MRVLSFIAFFLLGCWFLDFLWDAMPDHVADRVAQTFAYLILWSLAIGIGLAAGWAFSLVLR